jgi:hypothetical protein
LDQSGNPVTPLSPTTTFRAAGSAGADIIADRYVNPVDVTVTNVPPGSSVTLIMRVWRTSLGSYEKARSTCDFGESAPFMITLGGGGVPPAPLRTLRVFALGYLECPWGPPRIIGISLSNNQVIVSADALSGQTRLLASANLRTWTDLNLSSTPVLSTNFFNQGTFSLDRRLSYEYYRLKEP